MPPYARQQFEIILSGKRVTKVVRNCADMNGGQITQVLATNRTVDGAVVRSGKVVDLHELFRAVYLVVEILVSVRRCGRLGTLVLGTARRAHLVHTIGSSGRRATGQVGSGIVSQTLWTPVLIDRNPLGQFLEENRT